MEMDLLLLTFFNLCPTVFLFVLLVTCSTEVNKHNLNVCQSNLESISTKKLKLGLRLQLRIILIINIIFSNNPVIVIIVISHCLVYKGQKMVQDEAL